MNYYIKRQQTQQKTRYILRMIWKEKTSCSENDAKNKETNKQTKKNIAGSQCSRVTDCNISCRDFTGLTLDCKTSESPPSAPEQHKSLSEIYQGFNRSTLFFCVFLFLPDTVADLSMSAWFHWRETGLWMCGSAIILSYCTSLCWQCTSRQEQEQCKGYIGWQEFF